MAWRSWSSSRSPSGWAECRRWRGGASRAGAAVSFAVEAGSITGLIGPNGAGKTTTLNVINGLVRPDSGRVLFDGQDVTGRPPHLISRLGIGRMLQDPRVFQEMRALDNAI